MKTSEISGTGILRSSNVDITSTFTLEMYISADAVLFFDMDMMAPERNAINLLENKNFSFEGRIGENTTISIERAVLVHSGNIKDGKQGPLKLKVFSDISINKRYFVAEKSEKIIYRLSNLIFTGSERTVSPKGGWKLDHCTINISGYSLQIKQVSNYSDIEKSLNKKEFPYACTAEIEINTKHENKEKLRPLIHDICWLMSYATGNAILPFEEIYLKDEQLISRVRHSMRGEPFVSGNHVIPFLPPDEFPNFLEQVYDNYIKYKQEIGLNVIISYYELMKRTPIMDVRCVLGYVLLECLSNNIQEYNVRKGTPIKNALSRTKVARLKEILPKDGSITEDMMDALTKEFIYSNPSLLDALNILMKEIKMSQEKGEDELFKLRKEFIHRGKFPPDVNTVLIYNKLVHFIDRLILHTLGYTGQYLDIADRYKEKKLKYTS